MDGPKDLSGSLRGKLGVGGMGGQDIPLVEDFTFRCNALVFAITVFGRSEVSSGPFDRPLSTVSNHPPIHRMLPS